MSGSKRDWQCYPGCCAEIAHCAVSPTRMGVAYEQGLYGSRPHDTAYPSSPRSSTRNDQQEQSADVSYPQRSDERADLPEIRGGESGVPGAEKTFRLGLWFWIWLVAAGTQGAVLYLVTGSVWAVIYAAPFYVAGHAACRAFGLAGRADEREVQSRLPDYTERYGDQ